MQYRTKTAQLAEGLLRHERVQQMGHDELCRRTGLTRSRLSKLVRKPTLIRLQELCVIAGALGFTVTFSVEDPKTGERWQIGQSSVREGDNTAAG